MSMMIPCSKLGFMKVSNLLSYEKTNLFNKKNILSMFITTVVLLIKSYRVTYPTVKGRDKGKAKTIPQE